ncbi:MAG: NAD-dependent epimerase/dehydratase family protein [Frankiales bacterium]|nr:NAD-dependent epimerase/dehydratase family protein [Frankiales bacterium]
MSRVVLVTGVSRHLGSRMAYLLSHDPGVEKVVGVDIVPPREDIGGAEFVRADIRNPIIGKVIAAAGIDTVVHMGVISTPIQAGGRVTMKEINVIGTMQLLAACQKAPGISRLVVKSTSSVYGAGPKDPAMFTEDTEPRSQPRSGWAKDSVEVEAYVRGFARRRPDVAVTTFRFANFLGPRVETPMASYFGLPVVPTVLGHDARLQFVHEDDGLEAIRRAALEDHPGIFNVAGDGILMLSQAVRLAGKAVLPVPTPLVGVVGGWFRRAGLADFSPEQIKFLTYGRGLDTSRIRDEMGFVPTYTTRDAFVEFVHERGLDAALPKHRAEAIERGLAHALGSSTLSEARLSARLREEAPGRA